jgi:glycosyltransferase involved in cell wall biosynthesis
VTVSNEYLAEWATSYHHDVRILPMLVDASEYQPREHLPRSPVALGWIGNRYQVHLLRSLAPALRCLADSREIVVKVVSAEPVEIPGVPIESHTHPYSPATESEDFAGFDIGLLPLQDTTYDRGKSPSKLLQYFAAGAAVVATPIAMDASIVKPGECFLPAVDERGWLDAMTRLVDDHILRERLGRAARKVVLEQYSFEAHARTFYDALATGAASMK